MAKARISDQIATSLKDRVRSVQFRIKRRARAGSRASSGMQMIPQQIAMAADSIITQIQSAAMGLLPDSLRESSNFIFPAPISKYLGPQESDDFKFAPEIYYAVKGLVRRFSDGDCLVSEAALEAVYERMTERHGPAIAGALTGDPAKVTSACGALAAELASFRPIRAWVWEPNKTSSPRHFFLAPNQYVAFVVGLSIAVKSRPDEQPGEPALSDDEIVNLVDLAVDARFSELSAAMTSRNPTEILTKVFAEMLPFIA